MSDTASTTRCPACDGEIVLGSGVIVSELLKCGECGTDLEVTSVSPAGVAEAPAEEEDWGQ
jgi:alpha-aminoadipate/glutamate carrier protein LysW